MQIINANPLGYGALSKGLNGPVFSIIRFSGYLYIGGLFTSTYDNSILSRNIIAYNLTTNTFVALPNGGLNSTDGSGVRCITQVGTSLYIGGDFNGTNDSSQSTYSHKVIIFTPGTNGNPTTGTWTAMPNQGLKDSYAVSCITLVGSDLYIGGYFSGTQDNTQSFSNILKFTPDGTLGTGTWTDLVLKDPSGNSVTFNSDVLCITQVDSNLYIGGQFNNDNFNYIAIYNPSATNNLTPLLNAGTGTSTYGLTDNVNYILYINSVLYIGGRFTSDIHSPANIYNRIVQFTPSTTLGTGTWTPLLNTNTSYNGLSNEVYFITNINNYLYIAGGFSSTVDSSIYSYNFIRYSLSTNKFVQFNYAGIGTNGLATSYGSGNYVYNDTTNNTIYIGGNFNYNNINSISTYTQLSDTFLTINNTGVSLGYASASNSYYNNSVWNPVHVI